MKTKTQLPDKPAESGSQRIRKDGKPLFTEKLARVNTVLKKIGLPNITDK